MLENHPKMEKQKILYFFSQNETIIFKNQTITIKEQRLKNVHVFFSRLLRDTCSNSAISRNFFSQRIRYFSQLVREILATSPGTYFLRFVVAFSPAP